MYDSMVFPLFPSPLSLLENFQCGEGRILLRMHLYALLFAPSTGRKDVIYWELPRCGSFDAFSFFIQGGDNPHAAECWHCGSWVESHAVWKHFWMICLLTVFLHHCLQQGEQYLNACDGKSGNPIEQLFPSVASSLLTLLNTFTTRGTGTYNFHWERQEHTYSASWFFHLSSIPSVNVSLMCRYKSLKWLYSLS